MSRIGRQPIVIPQGVKVAINGHQVTVEGPKGKISKGFHPTMKIESSAIQIAVVRPSDARPHRELHGLTRTLIANMVEGVTKGYAKSLQIEGVGFRAEAAGGSLTLTVGYTHPVIMKMPEGISVSVEKLTLVTISGVDKQMVGEIAARVRRVRPPEPYKGKGIRYVGEYIRRKVGKAAATTTGGAGGGGKK
jgi:large subunit ribosomal protein L6